MITPSGTNASRAASSGSTAHSSCSANSFFNKRTSCAKPYLNRNQFGGRARRADHDGQAVLLRLLRRLPAAHADDAEQRHPGHRRFPAGRVPLRRDRRRQSARSTCCSSRACRSIPAVQQRHPRSCPAASNVNNFDVGNSTAAALNTRRLPLPPGRPQRPQPVAAPARLRGHARRTASRATTRCFSETRRPHRPRHDHTSGRSSSPTRRSSASSAPGAGRALAAAERSARRRQPGAGGVRERRGLRQAIFYMPAPLASTEHAPPTFQPQGRDTRTFSTSTPASYMHGRPRAAVRRQLPADPRQHLQLRGPLPDRDLRLQRGGAGRRAAHGRPVPGRHQRGRSGIGQRAAGLPRRHDLVGGARRSRCGTRTSGFVAGIPNDRNYTLEQHRASTCRTTGAGSRT